MSIKPKFELYEWSNRFVYLAAKDTKAGEEVKVGPLTGCAQHNTKKGASGIARCDFEFPVYEGVALLLSSDTVQHGTPLYLIDNYLTTEPIGEIYGYTYYNAYTSQTRVRFFMNELQIRHGVKMDNQSYKAAIQTVRDLQHSIAILQYAARSMGKISPKYHDNQFVLEVEEIRDRLKEIQHFYTGVTIRIEDESNN